jgi:hypothetical protein
MRKYAFYPLIFAIADFGDELVGDYWYCSIPHRLSHTEDQQRQFFIDIASDGCT